MATAQAGGDTERVLPSTSRSRQLLLAATIALLVATGLLFALPLAAEPTKRVSQSTLLALWCLLVVAQIMAVRRSRGVDRAAWVALLVTDIVLFILFTIDSGTDTFLPTMEALPAAFLLAPIAALEGIVILLVFARGVALKSRRVAFAADAAWLSVASLAILWPTVGDPVLHIGADSLTIAVVLSQSLVTCMLAGTLGALILRTGRAERWRMAEMGMGIVAIRYTPAIFYWGWVGNGIEVGSTSDLVVLTCIAMMVWTALRGTEAAGRLRATNPGVNDLLAVSWIPLAFVVASLAIGSYEIDGHGVTIIAAASVILLVRLSVELRQSSRLSDELHDAATTDPLTGLPNRATLEAALASAGAKLSAVMIVDLDRFKTVNDQLGLEVGDELLRRVAERLREAFGENWIVARAGGDEFVAISSAPIGNREARRLGEHIIDVLEPSFDIRGREAWIGASIGVATLEDGITSGELQSVADLALRHAKAAGRSEVVVANGSLRRRAGDTSELAGAIRRGLDEDQFFCLYQPRVDLVTGDIVGVEALVRWDHPSRGVLAPAEFLDVAEATGLIARIDQSVLHQSVDQLARWNEESPDRRLAVSVNMSVWQLARRDVSDDIARVLGSAALVDPAQIVVELTETVLIDDPNVVSRRLERLCSTGVRVSVDDFGAGFTSVAHLRRLPISEVKIDRSLVSELEHGEPTGRSVASAVVALGRALGLDVVAEGIENVEHARALAELGCRLGQGYAFSRPVHPDTISGWLATGESLLAAPSSPATSPVVGRRS